MTTTTTRPLRQPAIFIPHGAGPCFFMDWNPADAWDKTAAYLRGIPASLPEKPKAILLVTAHWLAPQPSMSSAAQPGMLFDYYGFPPHTYELSYPAPGAPQLAEQVGTLLAEAGFTPVQDGARGYDHGSFIPLLLAFPDADIPVLQLSLLRSLDAAEHLRMGRALRPLRDEGVLIIGSGNIVHNLRATVRGAPEGLMAARDWAQQFDDVVKQALQERNDSALVQYQQLHASSAMAVPTPDHYWPFLYALGAGKSRSAPTQVFAGFQSGTISMRCLQFDA